LSLFSGDYLTKKNSDVDWGPDIDSQFIRQASWTEMFRNQIYRRINLLNAKKILDVGCGSGVITQELRKKCSAKITGVDIDPQMIEFAKKRLPKVNFLVENVENLSAKDNPQGQTVYPRIFLLFSEQQKRWV